jgi:hypothetical protein
MEVHAYNPDLYILRENGCVNYEKPFLYLFFGSQKALLIDTGAGETHVAPAVSGVVDEWAARNHREPPPLIVGHSHSFRPEYPPTRFSDANAPYCFRRVRHVSESDPLLPMS